MHDLWVVVTHGVLALFCWEKNVNSLTRDLCGDIMIKSSSINQTGGGYDEYDENSFDNHLTATTLCMNLKLVSEIERTNRTRHHAEK